MTNAYEDEGVMLDSVLDAETQRSVVSSWRDSSNASNDYSKLNPGDIFAIDGVDGEFTATDITGLPGDTFSHRILKIDLSNGTWIRYNSLYSPDSYRNYTKIGVNKSAISQMSNIAYSDKYISRHGLDK